MNWMKRDQEIFQLSCQPFAHSTFITHSLLPATLFAFKWNHSSHSLNLILPSFVLPYPYHTDWFYFSVTNESRSTNRRTIRKAPNKRRNNQSINLSMIAHLKIIKVCTCLPSWFDALKAVDKCISYWDQGSNCLMEYMASKRESQREFWLIFRELSSVEAQRTNELTLA